ncbi:MAG: class I SAM-dependent methyltransferase [Thermodesulfobacteriota bacterium]
MAEKRGYQLHLSRGDSALKNIEGRTQKFEKIISVLQDFHPRTQSLKCLDIGCSSGIITSLLGNHFQMSIGLDIDQEAIEYAKKHSASAFVQFLIADSMALPFHDNSLDAIVCNHVYEHVPDAQQMINEIYRVLKENGFCYFSAGNKYMIIEGHYGLPFLSFLPKPIAHRYLKIAGKGSFYYEEHLPLRGLRRLVKKFRVRDYTLPVIQNPEKFFAIDLFPPKSFLYKGIRLLAPHLYPWIPTYIWVLTKK